MIFNKKGAFWTILNLGRSPFADKTGTVKTRDGLVGAEEFGY